MEALKTASMKLTPSSSTACALYWAGIKTSSTSRPSMNRGNQPVPV